MSNRAFILFICVICAFFFPVSAGEAFQYQKGQTDYDYQPCWMRFDISGDVVSHGILEKEGTCETNIHLTKTILNFNGSVVNGPWEGNNGTATITGTWTGGDSLCGKQLTDADGYPQAGTFTIFQQNGQIVLKRTGTSPLPTDYQYLFPPTGKTMEIPANNVSIEDNSNEPVTKSIILLFDASGSMADDNKIDNAKSAAIDAIHELSSTTEVALLVFSDCGKIDVLQPYTTDKNAIISGINTIQPSGSTPLYDAIDFANDYKINARSSQRSIVLFTDGIETCR